PTTFASRLSNGVRRKLLRMGPSSLLRPLLRLGQFQKIQHLFPDEGASAFVAEIHMVFINDHDAHFHPFRPAWCADVGLDLGLKPAQEQRFGDRVPLVSATHAVDLWHNSIPPGGDSNTAFD